jgi:hypothetical protein
MITVAVHCLFVPEYKYGVNNIVEHVMEASGALAEKPVVNYVTYESESQLPLVMRLMEKDLSEPYSIYTYRYFINNWPKLCWLVRALFCFPYVSGYAW